MEIDEANKYLKTLERVKGIEPSYSAWKAAALPLSYTRATDELSRQGGGLNRYAGFSDPVRRALAAGREALTPADSLL